MAKDAAGNDIPDVQPDSTPPPVEPTELDLLKKQNEELVARVAEQTAAMERMTQIMAQPVAQPQPIVQPLDALAFGDDFATKYSIPVEAAQEIARRTLAAAREEYRREQSAMAQMKDVHDRFYKENTDLVEHKAVVAAFADELQKENPQVSLKEACKEAARRAREYIKKVQDGVQVPAPLPVLPGGGSRDGQPPAQPDGPVTPEDELRAELKERQDQRAKAVGR